MKIAICLSGFMRTFEETYSSLQTHFLKPNEDHQIDFFISTWDKPDGHLLMPIDRERIKKLYHPKKMEVESSKVFEISTAMNAKNIYGKRDPQRICSMFYKIKQCEDLKYVYEEHNGFKYDCVIRMRSDIKLEEPLIINLNDLQKLNIPMFGDFMGINDQMAWSNSDIMHRYSQAFDHLNEYMDHLVMTDPELLLKSHLLNEGIPVRRVALNYKLLCHGQALDNLEREVAWTNAIRK